MKLNGYDVNNLTRGLQASLDMMADQFICAIIVVGVNADGHGIKSWSGGDERVADQVIKTITTTLPFTPSTPAPSDYDDGA